MRKGFVVTVAVMLFTACGPGSQLPNAGQANPAAVSDILPGTYNGEISVRTELFLNKGLETDETTSQAHRVVVDASGLPLIQPEGVPPADGLQLTEDTDNGKTTLTVESVNSSLNSIVVTYTLTLERLGLELSGPGTWTYEFIPPDGLIYSGESSLSGTGAEGDVIEFKFTESADLSR